MNSQPFDSRLLAHSRRSLVQSRDHVELFVGRGEATPAASTPRPVLRTPRTLAVILPDTEAAIATATRPVLRTLTAAGRWTISASRGVESPHEGVADGVRTAGSHYPTDHGTTHERPANGHHSRRRHRKAASIERARESRRSRGRRTAHQAAVVAAARVATRTGSGHWSANRTASGTAASASEALREGGERGGSPGGVGG